MFEKKLSISGKKWIIKASDLESKNFLDRIKFIRNLKEEDFDINLSKHWPYLDGLTDGINIFIKHLEQKNEISIFGDYDVDGICGTAIMLQFLDLIKLPYVYKIPNRFEDGYGLTKELIKKTITSKTKLLIAIDNGTTAIEAINYAIELGLEVIIIDHHSPQEKPNANVIINPKVYSQNNRDLCASSLVFVFCLSLHKALLEQKLILSGFDLTHLLELAAIATICDVMPLKGFNRALVHKALKKINSKPSLHLKLLLNQHIGTVDVYHFGFLIGPLINAAGRMHNPQLALDFLLEKEEIKIKSLIFQLAALNCERKELQKDLLQKIQDYEDSKKKIEDFYDSGSNINFFIEEGIVCFISSELHEGIIGIIAGRLKDKYNKPSCIIILYNELAKASLRSIEGFNVSHFINELIEKQIIKQGGGHSLAGGFTMERSKIIELLIFIKNYNFTYNKPPIIIDEVLSLNSLNLCLKVSQILSPFGEGNEPLKFLIPNCHILKMWGAGDHSFLQICNNMHNKEIVFISNFYQSPFINLSIGIKYHFVCTIYLNQFRKTAQLQLLDAMEI